MIISDQYDIFLIEFCKYCISKWAFELQECPEKQQYP